MKRRIPPSERVKQEVEAVLRGQDGGGHPLDTLVRLGAQYLLQRALEEEVQEFLGRGSYRHGGQVRGWRNGSEPKALQTPVGVLTMALPQVRATAEPFRSRVAAALRPRSEALKRLVLEMYVRGLSTRDVEAVFLEAFREEVLSRSGVSRLGRELQAEFDRWRSRDLSELPVVYLFLDACYLPVRQGVREKEGVLCAYAILEDGRKVLLHLGLGSRESSDAWLGFLHELVARGLREPVLVVSDGQPGLLKALGEVFPQVRRQRCLVHKLRNILAKVPRGMQAGMKRLVHQVYQASTYDEGKRRAQALIARFRERYPSAMACLAEDLEACLEHLRFPQVHRRRIRTTKLLESIFGAVRLRTDAARRLRRRENGLYLVFKIAQRLSGTWRALNGGENLMALVVARCTFSDGILQRSELRQEVAAVA